MSSVVAYFHMLFASCHHHAAALSLVLTRGAWLSDLDRMPTRRFTNSEIIVFMVVPNLTTLILLCLPGYRCVAGCLSHLCVCRSAGVCLRQCFTPGAEEIHSRRGDTGSDVTRQQPGGQGGTTLQREAKVLWEVGRVQRETADGMSS